MKNRKTTAFGIATLAATALKIYTSKDCDAQDVAAIATAIGLILAKDSNVTGGTVQQ